MPENLKSSHGALLSLASWAEPLEDERSGAASARMAPRTRESDAHHADVNRDMPIEGVAERQQDRRSVRDLLLDRANGVVHSDVGATEPGSRASPLVSLAHPVAAPARRTAAQKMARRGLMSRIGSLFGSSKTKTPRNQQPASAVTPPSAANGPAHTAPVEPAMPLSEEPVAQPDARSSQGPAQAKPAHADDVFTAEDAPSHASESVQHRGHRGQAPERPNPANYVTPAPALPQVPIQPLPVQHATPPAGMTPWHPMYGAPYGPPRLPYGFPPFPMHMPQPASAHFYWPVLAYPPVPPMAAWGVEPPYGPHQPYPAMPTRTEDRPWQAEHASVPQANEPFADRTWNGARAPQRDITAEIDEVRDRLRDFAELLRELRELRRTA